MADLTRIGKVIADDWQRQKGDAARLFDPALSDGPVDDAADLAARLADDFERDYVALQGRIRLAARPFIADWPALARWRESVLAAPRRHPPAVVAAALEAMALECVLAGHPELAQRARDEAEAFILNALHSSAQTARSA